MWLIKVEHYTLRYFSIQYYSVYSITLYSVLLYLIARHDSVISGITGYMQKKKAFGCIIIFKILNNTILCTFKLMAIQKPKFRLTLADQ
jgi:hypothetical protein